MYIANPRNKQLTIISFAYVSLFKMYLYHYIYIHQIKIPSISTENGL